MKKKAGIILLAMVIIVVIAAGCITWSGMNDRIGQADVALVLGNKVHPDGTPSDRLKGRLDRAVELFNDGHFSWIIVSGGTGKEGIPEGTAMKEYLINSGIPESAIIVDDDGNDTKSSAAHTAEIMKREDMHSVFIISQFYHIPRSKLAMSKYGFDEHFHAHSKEFSARDVYSTLREVPAYVKYMMLSTDDE